MTENTKIEWCDHTFNPWIGCQKVSPGCDFCYAEEMMDKRYKRVQWGPHGTRIRTSSNTWAKPRSWSRHAKHFQALHDRRQRVFCSSLADWLDNKIPEKWRNDLAELIETTPYLDWLLLTKRIENFKKLAPWHFDSIPKNVWLGITCENQEWFDRRYPILASIPCSVRFVSYEPAIGPLSLRECDLIPDWIICGGETGRHAREMSTEWARSLRDECAGTVPFFMKQMTNRKPIPTDLFIREFPSVE